MKRAALLPLAALLSIGIFSTVPCYGKTAQTARHANPAKPAPPPAQAADAADAIKEDIKVGTGPAAIAGQTVSINYTGWLYDESRPGYRGQRIDSSLDRGKPFRFKLGAGRVIKGWDEGITGMKVDGQRTLIIPGGLAYTTLSAGGVAVLPDTPLIFDIELLGVN
ncbi:MAG: FKBP-type peptidyl-prolyl cis-trans isomerase [Sideroxydans sp.]|nr:FKBP-type peptidyl-prolyl cis-trans isomerase [Sideroxydans sp.]